MKGISPVVATVLLIAIAVIAAIGVWYWVGAYTGKPAVGVSQNAMSIESCKIDAVNGNASVLIRNTGSLTLDKNATVYTSAGALAGTIQLDGANNMTAGAVGYKSFYNASDALATGVYSIVDDDYPSYSFTCN